MSHNRWGRPTVNLTSNIKKTNTGIILRKPSELEIRPVERGIFPIAKSTMTELFLWKFRRFGHQIRVTLHIFNCACAKRLYFYLRSKIWRYHRVPRPRLLVRRGNFGDSRTFNADIGLLIFAWICRTSWSKRKVSCTDAVFGILSPNFLKLTDSTVNSKAVFHSTF